MKKSISLTKPDERGLVVRLLKRIIAENGRLFLRQYSVAIVCLVLVAGTTAFLAWIMRDVIDEIFVKQNRSAIITLPVVVFIAFAVRGLATYGQGVILARIGNNIVARYQRRLFAHLTELSVDFFSENRSAHLAARINQNVSGIRDTLNLTVTTLARDVLSLIFLVFVMIYQDPVLSAIALLAGPPIALMIAGLARKLRSATRQSIDLNARVLASMQEAAQGISVVKAFTMEKPLRERIERLIVAAEERSNRIATITERTTPVTEIVAGLAIAGVIAYSGYRAIVYGYSPGSMFAFITALLFAYDPARRLAKLQVQLERALVNAQMIYEILDLEPRQPDRPDAPELVVSGGEVVFENVGFSYYENEPVLRGLDFVAPAGKTTAVIGASGGGKSTLVALLQRFYDVDEGRILIDGQDISTVAKRSLREKIAYVPQAPYLFEGTIRDNIRLGRPDATDAEIEEAARLAQAEEFIVTQPNGYDTPLGENGVTLSGGQRQRLSIARALVRDAPILLLDEATSALDTRSETLVQMALEEASRDRTVIVVAHRLSTIVGADQILVVDGGRIVERGTHGELVDRQEGHYARFYGLQGREGRDPARALADTVRP
ncbi:MAG: ABC transporter ATP-binding protein [Aurantimonas endophytica]|uniref:ATP-binding cassette subfamily B protein n=1 Tax=Aurantimonas endophytica TaxID=1522175 RepID=A0A7W6MRU9_9HYPH|nr:ATP-binding cassette subfamily B protein [Aurantimonas endophytica]MCO6405870.1 ATP-binding cassette domain-containing protein [Aurantimonas endophytica]